MSRDRDRIRFPSTLSVRCNAASCFQDDEDVGLSKVIRLNSLNPFDGMSKGLMGCAFEWG